jgi:uncharacterized membrane protein YphA (DoxX/SURF4 family)
MSENNSRLSTFQLVIVTLLRVAIGWHFLYEGLVKLLNPNWSAAAFLVESKWLFSDLFQSIAMNSTALQIINLLNIWGLILIGAGLLLGTFTRIASFSGIALLLLYYIANPPFIGFSPGLPTEGSYIFVDKNLVEMMALLVISIIPTGTFLGLDRLLLYAKTTKIQRPIPKERARKSEQTPSWDRRELIKGLATVPILGAFVFALLKKRAWESYEEKHLQVVTKHLPTDGTTGATIKTFRFTGLKELKGEMPAGQIGNLKLSRLVLGGNLIGGWAHARDLIYVSKLIKAYHHDQKVFDTLRLAEQAGVNTLLTNPQLGRVINAYWRKEGGNINFISDCGFGKNCLEGLSMSIDGGAHAAYIQGGIADKLVIRKDFDIMQKFLDETRKNGIPAGIGGHSLETIMACVEQGIKPDFWVKTLHHTNYWSANKENQHDNIWCVNPEETIEFMNTLKEPWIAFKTLAAGAIKPDVGFPYAFQNGADFICVGMYDFQIVDDVNLALDALAHTKDRKRPWRA